MTKTNTAHKVGTLRELVMAHLAYERSLDEFRKANGITTLNDQQQDALIHVCDSTDPREVGEDTLIQLNLLLEAAK